MAALSRSPMLRGVIPSLLAAILLFPTAGASAGDSAVKLKLSFFTSDRSSIYQYSVKPFVDAVNAEGRGQVEIEVFFSGGISADQEQQAQIVSEGAADLAVIVPGYSPDRFPDTAVVELPGLFRDGREAGQVYLKLLEQGLLAGYQDYVVLGAFVSPSESIHSRLPIAGLADLNGRTIRCNNPIEVDILQKLGALPVVLPINQTTEALGRNQITGVTLPPTMLFEFGVGRVTAYHYMLGLGGAPTALVMNRAKFDSLPEPAKTLIQKYAGAWLSEKSATEFFASDQAILAKLKDDPKRNVIAPDESDLTKVHTVFEEIIRHWVDAAPRHRELFAQVQAEIARLRTEN